MPCSECGKQVNLHAVKYFTADQQHVFCDAYCSFAWHQKTWKKEDEEEGTVTDRSENNGTD